MKDLKTLSATVRKYGFLLTVLAIPLLLAAQIVFPTWQDYNASAGSIAGVWISSQQNSPEDNPWIWTETLTPLDSTGTRFAYRAWSPNPGVNYAWLGLTETQVHGLALGEFVQTGENEFYFTVICHGAKGLSEDHAHAQLQWVWYWVGTAWISDEGTLVKDGTWQLYNSVDVMDPVILDKDADDDGFPDEGVKPLLCGAWPMESKRVQLQPRIVVEHDPNGVCQAPSDFCY